jgi:virginiamycin A acetyltransferase
MSVKRSLYKLFRKTGKKLKQEKISNSGYREDLFTNKKTIYKKYDIGDYTYGAPKIYDYDDYDDIATRPTKLKIGKFCSIGVDVKIILGSEHRADWVTTYPFNALNSKFRHIKGHPHSKGDITIGNDVWIGANVTILSGVTVGNGAVIGANSLVTKSVDPYAVAMGVPAKHIKYRFNEDVISRLQKLQWWNLPIDKIEECVELLQSDDIVNFLTKMENNSQFNKI